jgi:hypothetical protein
LQLKLEGKKELLEQLQQEHWTRLRFQTVSLINKDRKRNQQIKLHDLIKFPWEKTSQKKIEAGRSRAEYLIAKARKENG